jgi:hypothetical protein
MNENWDLLIVGTERFQIQEALADLNEEIIVIVHLLDDFDDVGDELISNSIMAEDWGDDGDFGCSIELEGGIVALKFFNINCAIFLLTVV